VRYASLSSGGTDTIARIAGDGHKGRRRACAPSGPGMYVNPPATKPQGPVRIIMLVPLSFAVHKKP
jgi:hypothetical protein